MAEVGVALAAARLDPHHPMAVVLFFGDPIFGQRLPKTGPTRTRLVLGVGTEQIVAAARAAVDPTLLVVTERAGEGPLGALLTGDMLLFLGQITPPFRVALGHFLSHDSSFLAKANQRGSKKGSSNGCILAQ